tara:strand:- start:656 stop:1930 length:1275 start_codon:yes stop_codon:yes gene_type:complete
MSTNKKIIHFFRYLEYDDLEDLGFDFEKPEKNIDSGIYSAKIKVPVYFYLPKSEILEVFQDDFSMNKARYRINLDEHSELLEFCDNLDSLCINLASKNSKSWFSKFLTADILIKYIQGIYDTLENEEVSLDIDIVNLSHLDDLSDYNNNDEKNILIKIDSIEFFKQTFRLKLTIDDIVDDIELDNSYSEDEDVDDKNSMDFTAILEKTSNDGNLENDNVVVNNVEEVIPEEKLEGEKLVNEEVVENEEVVGNEKVVNIQDKEELINKLTNIVTKQDVSEKEHENSNEEENVQRNESPKNELPVNVDESKVDDKVLENNVTINKGKEDIKSISHSEVINEEVVRDLAENVDTDMFGSDMLSQQEISEIENLISEKNIQKAKYLINAERAEKASQSLFKKAKETEDEIKSLSSKIKAVSISNSSNI